MPPLRHRTRTSKKSGKTSLWGILGYTLLALLGTPILLTLLYAFLPVPGTPLMLLRLSEGHGINSGLNSSWTPIGHIHPSLPRAVIAAEDNLFCRHAGFDWKSLNRAVTNFQRKGMEITRHTKGGSTLSQQTAKNVFLWPGRSVIRKGLEFPLTLLIENLWSKQRILEVYLNVVEWAPGVYGVRAAAQHHFGTTPDKLTARQSAQLAAVLPSPRRWNAGKPGPYISRRAGVIQGRTYKLGPLLNCLPGRPAIKWQGANRA